MNHSAPVSLRPRLGQFDRLSKPGLSQVRSCGITRTTVVMNGDHATEVVHRLDRLQPILPNGQYICLLTNNAQSATILFRTDGLKSSDDLIEHN